MKRMKYITRYLEEVMHIKPLGEVMVDEDGNVLIAGKKTGICVSWESYATWLEKRNFDRWMDSAPGNGQLG